MKLFTLVVGVFLLLISLGVGFDSLLFSSYDMFLVAALLFILAWILIYEGATAPSEFPVIKIRDVTPHTDHEGKLDSQDPLEILKIRLAKGEITSEQYEALKKTISSS